MADRMPTVELKLKPMLTPNYVQVDMPPGAKEDGVRELPSIAVKDLPEQALDAIVSQWLTDLYKKAGKPNAWALFRHEGKS